MGGQTFEEQWRQREIQRRALTGGGNGHARTVGSDLMPQSVGPDGLVPAGGIQLDKKDVALVTVTQSVSSFKAVLSKTKEEDLRKMYDALMLEVNRRGLRL